MIRELTSLDDPAFAAMLTLYNDTFPPEEREPDERLREEIEGRYRLLFRFLVWEDEGLAGFIRFVELKMIPAIFVIHLAVAPDRQRKGIGLGLLNALGDRTVIAETEDGPPLKWWLGTAGSTVVTRTYTQPALRPETCEVPLVLVCRGSHDGNFESIVESFYQEVWQRPSSDPLVRKALAGVEK